VTIVTVVGIGMRTTPGVAGRIFAQLGNRDINVLAIAQGSSEVSISMVVDPGATEAAVKALHELIIK
jgi:aspartate kinase